MRGRTEGRALFQSIAFFLFGILSSHQYTNTTTTHNSNQMTEKYVPSPEVVEHGLYVAYAALSTMAVVPIYFGSFAALKKWKVKLHMRILD